MRDAPGPFPARDGFVPVIGGRLYWRSLGARRDPTILAVHGGPSEHGYLRFLEDLVPEGYRVVWYDQWGCGRSTRGPVPPGYGPNEAAQHTERVRRSLRLGRPFLFGHSWGGAVALAAVAQFPRSYAGALLCGAFASEPSFVTAMHQHLATLPASIRIPIEAGERSGRIATAAYRRAVRRRRATYSQGIQVLPLEFRATEANLNRSLLRSIYGEPRRLLGPTTGTLAAWDVRPQLRRVRLPTLLLAGEREAGRFTALELHRLWPHAKLVIVPGAAHLPFYSARDRFLSEVLSFLRRARMGAPTDRRRLQQRA